MSRREQLRYGGGCLQNLLEVVEQEEQPPLVEVVHEALKERSLSCLPHPKRLCHGREEQFGFGEGGELRKEGAVGEVLKEVCGRLQGEPCLADPARTGESEQARRLAAQEVAHLRHLFLAPYKRSGLEGEVVAVNVESPQGRELHGQIRS